MKRCQIPKRLRKKINASGIYSCDVCGKNEILVEHHLNGRYIQNANHPSNLAKICSNCHFRVHHGDIIIEQWVSGTNGKELLWHNKEKESFSGNDSNPYLIC